MRTKRLKPSIDRLKKECNSELFTHFSLISKECKSVNQPVLLKGEYGIVKSNFNKLCNHKSIPDIRSAIDKSSYFRSMAKEVHGDKYDYCKSKYIRNTCKVIIICPDHGEFKQQPSNHLQGRHCYQCAREAIRQSQSENSVGWTDSKWEEKGKISKYFDSFKLYVIECKNDNERFIKIGKTFNTVNRRHKDKHSIPYDWNLIKVISSEAKNISKLERKIKKELTNQQYIPENKFGGCYECFTYDCLERILTYIETY